MYNESNDEELIIQKNKVRVYDYIKNHPGSIQSRAYTKLKIRGMFFVSAAFGIFAARTIAIETRDLYLGGGYSPGGYRIYCCG